MFAFSMAIKLNEESEDNMGAHGDISSGGLRMKELELLQAINQHADSKGHLGSSTIGYAQSVKRNNRSIIDKKSDTGSQNGISLIAQ